MGPKASKQIQSHELSINHPRFQNSKTVLVQNQKFMHSTLGIDQQDFTKWSDKLKNQNPDSRYLLLPTSQQFSSKGLCGSSGTLNLNFEYFPHLLSEQIVSRQGKKRTFEQNQLWYLLFVLISAKNGTVPPFSKIGDVRPQNIFINEQAEIKVSNTHSWPRENTNFLKTFDGEVTYLAPEQVQQLAKGSTGSEDSNNEAELFSIGLTVLSAATLQDNSDLYDVKKHTFNGQLLGERVEQFVSSRAYSDILKGTVLNLIDSDPNRRVNSRQLFEWIAPHQQKIKARQNFYFPSAPQKIDRSVHSLRQTFNPQPQNQPFFRATQPQTVSSTFNSITQPYRLTSQPPVTNYTYSGFNSIPSHMQAESIYVPASTLNSNNNVTFNSNLYNRNTVNSVLPDRNTELGKVESSISQQESAK